ncbi:hypothetical protein [uncultured Jannaschia sp.]|uniref:alpha/beta fold hydrolase n=1 Tax=uncultured Jannaschia sp. TaxID=293347 RepID=UPI0026203F99|nr:hypothetical protein [uncultured Jannaschia sp.]
MALDVRDTEAVVAALLGLGVPARIVWGAADRFPKIRYGERLTRAFSAPLRRIGGGKHFALEDHPGVVANEINARVATASASSPRSV